MQDLVASGQLKLSRVPSERNPADVLTKYLQASTLHKLLPKLGVMTRAVDSKDLLSVISLEGRVSSQPPTRSFFIGMLAESHASAQLVASRAYSRRSLPRSLRPESQQDAEAQPTPTSFTWSSFRWFYLCSAALLCLPFFFQIFDFKLYGAFAFWWDACSSASRPYQLSLGTSSFENPNCSNSFQNLIFSSFGELESEKLTSNASS